MSFLKDLFILIYNDPKFWSLLGIAVTLLAGLFSILGLRKFKLFPKKSKQFYEKSEVEIKKALIQEKGLKKEFDDVLIKDILEQLYEAYPNNIEYDRYILPDHRDRKEMSKYIVYCEGEGWITFKEIKARNVHNYWFIKITNGGIKHLLTLRKNL